MLTLKKNIDIFIIHLCVFIKDIASMIAPKILSNQFNHVVIEPIKNSPGRLKIH